MPDYELEYLNIICPEGYGEARILFKFLIHKTSRRGSKVIDKRTPFETVCDLQDELLKQGEKCRERCKNTDKYRNFLKSIPAG